MDICVIAALMLRFVFDRVFFCVCGCVADATAYQYMDYRSSEYTRCLMVSSRAALTQEQVFALFDLIPGLEYCELQRDSYGMSKGDASIHSLLI